MADQFSQLKASVQRERISVAADVILSAGPLGTRQMSEAIARALKTTPAVVGPVLARMASAGDPRARATGDTFRQYGKVCRRYTWAAVGAAAPAKVPGLDPSDVAAFLEWKAQQEETPRQRAERLAAQFEATDPWTVGPDIE